MATAIEQTIEGKNLEQNQRKAVLADGKNICVNAGAGSGKTFTILAKVLHLLDQQIAKPEEIVVVAYNNRVAAELRTRISKLSSSFPNLKEKLKRISISEGEKCPECNQKIEVALHKCESNKKYIERKIHTFHSYCYDQLKKNETKKLAKFLNRKEKNFEIFIY
jgi:superfamily I DNA/RNA helicase